MPNTCLYPRPEYPRPDRQRGTREGYDWLNLNGPWQFRFDGERRGRKEGWHLPDDLLWREQLIVPFCWESLAAWREGDAAGNENYYSTRVFLNPLEVSPANHRSAPRYEIGWYRRRVEIPNNPAWQNKRVIMTVGAADYFTEAWCNGRELGRHEGGYTPFEFDLTETLTIHEDGRRSGLVVLRVEDPMDNHEQPVGKQWRWYTPVSGIWQTVFVEPRNIAHVESFRLTPDLDAGTVHLYVQCREADGCRVSAQIRAPDGSVLPEEDFEIVEGLAHGTVLVRPVLAWDPNSPHLYPTRLTLRRGEAVLDQIQTYFGMRKIDFTRAETPEHPVQLRLNNEPRYLRGALYQSFFPEGVYTAGDAERLRDDIVSAKRAGFNFLRIHIKVDDPLVLYYADTLGILLMADFPNLGEGGNTPLGQQRFEQMMRTTIQRDYNHPSIVAWCLFNETWGFGGQLDLVQQIQAMREKAGTPLAEFDPAPAVPTATAVAEASDAVAAEALGDAGKAAARSKLANLPAQSWVQAVWELAKKLDPTRLVEDMSVCVWEHLDYYAHGDTDINSWHFYINDYARAKKHIEEVAHSTYVGSTFNYVPGYEHRGQPLINSEYGGVGALDGDRDVSWSFRFLTNELRRHDKISAYIYTELHDVEWEYNGFLNYDRTPKAFGYDPAIINASNVLPIDAPPVTRIRLGQVLPLSVASSHYSVRPSRDVTLVWRVGGVDTLGRLHQDLQSGAQPIPFPHRCVAPAHTIELRMPGQPMLCTVNLQAVTSDGTVVARNFVHYFVSDQYPPFREEMPRSIILRPRPADWTDAQWSGRMRTRARAEAEDSCFGHGAGFFEWSLLAEGVDLTRLRRIRILCEASARRFDAPQTDEDRYPTTLEVQLNGFPVERMPLPNHPHDSRGVLSYWRNGRGAYGYLVNSTIEGELLDRVLQQTNGQTFRLRCSVPPEGLPQGGLTIYGAECGRYPLGPTLILET